MIRLVVLGLLIRQPMHGYEIQQQLEVGYAAHWAGILAGSIYHALKKMEVEGFVAIKATEQSGLRLRAVYAITESGREEFHKLLRETWRTPQSVFPRGLYTALAFLTELPVAEVRDALSEQIVAMEKELRLWGKEEVAKGEVTPLLGWQQAVFVNAQDHLQADLRFLHALQKALSDAPQ